MQGLMVGYLGYGAAAAAYLGLALFYLWRGRWGAYGLFFLGAVGATVAWALAALHGHDVIPRHAAWTMLLQQLAMLAWVWFLWRIIASLEPYRIAFPRRLRLGGLLIAGLVAITVALHGVNLSIGLRWVEPFNTAHLPLVLGLVIALVGLSLTETLYRGYQSAERWGVKFLCLATGGLFAYDVFLFGEGLLFRALDPAFVDMRGFAQALVVPFLIINIRRSEARHFALGLSHRLVFGSSVVIGAGVYLAIMAAAAFYVRVEGGAWGGAMQIVFLFAAVLLLLAFLLSGSARASVRAFLSRHIFEDRYDYRGEWLRFSKRLAAADSSESFELRVVRALADIVDSPAGALWSTADDHMPLAAVWNIPSAGLPALSTEGVAAYFESEFQVRTIGPGSASPAGLSGVPKAWALVPLLHQDRLFALLLLAEPRSPRDLAPEDAELLGVAARQAAGLLAERGLARDLAEARQFERFNQRYAFVAHDLKNLVSQLGLVVRNHERFGDRPDFQGDMIETIQSAVARMEHVMTRLSGATSASETDDHANGSGQAQAVDDGASAPTALAPVLRDLATEFRDRVGDLELRLPAEAEALHLKTDGTRLESMLRHLLQNAAEAAGADGLVTIASNSHANRAVIEVGDNGPGMDARFIEERLFKPFQSTKNGGFGIGAYQCRALARELGGDLEAVSTPGAGTIMRLSLPRA